MGSRNTVLFFAAIALFAFLHFPSQTEATLPTELVSKVCAQTVNLSYEFCVNFLMANPKSLLVNNMKAVAENALDMARRETADTSSFFAAFLKRKDINPASMVALERCSSFFKQAVTFLNLNGLSLERCSSFFKQAVTFLNLNGLSGGTASLDVHSALDKATECKSELSAANVSIKSVAEKLEGWRNFYSIASAAVRVVENP